MLNLPPTTRFRFAIQDTNKTAVAKNAPIKPEAPKQPKQMLALLISAHNEELVISQTLNSAIRAGMKPENIYVVDDNSSDATSKIAKSIIGEDNVIKVRRSGKGLALTKANKHFKLTKRYRWIHIADADGGFAPNYFRVFRSRLRIKYAAATGYVRSLPAGPISQYRVFEYTIGLEIHRRFQAKTHTVTVIPGPTSCFRADVFEKLNFATGSLTEDFDATLQIHRNKMGKILFIPQAVAYTQDPKNIRDFVKQISRWYRGTLQGVREYKIGRRPQRIDAYLSYQIFQNFLFFANYFILVPIVSIAHHSAAILSEIFIFDVVLTWVLTLAVAARSQRWDILSAFPFIYACRYISMFVFMRSFIEVIILRRFKHTKGSWSTAGRRYKTAGI
jgi:cellulose synthase/poly-beta-1,6-N-acetylglucosamine synthase-like glycosyltransferase